jgi:hypothetical protein
MTADAAQLLNWGPHSVAVPSGSPLDRPARVELVAPAHVSARDAREWCARRGVRFVRWKTCDDRGAPVVVFDVDGFSRYGFDQPADAGGGQPAGEQRIAPPYPSNDAGMPPSKQAMRQQEQKQVAHFPGSHLRSTGSEIQHGSAVHKRRIFVPMLDDDDDDDDDNVAGVDDHDNHKDDRGEDGYGHEDYGSSIYREEQGQNERVAENGTGGQYYARADDMDIRTPSRMDDVAISHSTKCRTPLRPSPAMTAVRSVAQALFHDSRGADTFEGPRGEHIQQQDPFPWRSVVALRSNRDSQDDDYDNFDFDGGDRFTGNDSVGYKNSDMMSDGLHSARHVGFNEKRHDAEWFHENIPSSLSRPLPMQYAPVMESAVADSLDVARTRGPDVVFARSFRPGWDRQGRMFVPLWDRTPRAARTPHFACELRSVAPQLFSSAPAPASLYTIPRDGFVMPLRVHAVAWAVARSSHGRNGPRDPQIPTLRNAFTNGVGIAETVLDSLIESFSAAEASGLDPNAGHARIVFGLLAALYRQPSNPDDNLLRRVASWFGGPACSMYDAPVPTSAGLPRALALLTIGDVDGAVESAASAGYLRLALLIARAAESDKEALRADALSQLEAYGLFTDGNPNPGLLDEKIGDPNGDVFHDASVTTLLSVDERLILCLLAGFISPVAQYLRPSWYRVFAMELLYGAGSSNQSSPERISLAVAAMAAIADEIAFPPHGHPTHRDAAYHLLRLYADPTASYPLTAGVYSAGSFGVVNDPLDARFPWLLHQALAALVPQAQLPDAIRLSDALAAQLDSAGLPLWSFYVMCSGSPPAAYVKDVLVRSWHRLEHDRIEMAAGLIGHSTAEDSVETSESSTLADEDNGMDIEDPGALGRARMGSTGDAEFPLMGAFTFLVHILKIPKCWIHEARAVHCRIEIDVMSPTQGFLQECENWMHSGTELGLMHAQDLIVDELFPRAVSLYDVSLLVRIAELLRSMNEEKRLSNWSTRGGLILDYLTHLAPETSINARAERVEAEVTTCMSVYQSMAQRVVVYMSLARTPVQRHAAVTIANGVACGERIAALRRPMLMDEAAADLERMPVSSACARRICAELRHQAVEGGRKGAVRFAAALPHYAPFFRLENQRRAKVEMTEL